MNTLCVYDNVNDDENLWELTIKSKKLKQRKTACGCTLTKLFSTIYANTPWQVLHLPPRICQRGLAGFPLAPVQRTYNERERVYTITFLPPGMFLYSHLHLLINKISSKKRSKPNPSFSENKPHKSFSLREENILLSRRERFTQQFVYQFSPSIQQRGR